MATSSDDANRLGVSPGNERAVEVEWLDSTSVDLGEWTAIDEGLPTVSDLTYRSCGYVVANDGQVLTLAVGVDAEGKRACGVLAIPWAAVRAVHLLARDAEA